MLWILLAILIYACVGFCSTIFPLLKLEYEDRVSAMTRLTCAVIWAFWPLYWIAPFTLIAIEDLVRRVWFDDKK